MPKTYTHLFFDLDRTLWDFERNSELALKQLYRDFQLQAHFGNFILFKNRYEYHNQKLWLAYYQNRIEKKELIYRRFYLCIKEAGFDDIGVAQEMGQDYLEISPLQTRTFPNTHKTLEYLKQKGYHLHIITNGFNEVQGHKLENCKLANFFDNLITSEDAGYTKPHPAIFEYALKTTGAKLKDSLMIGDDLKTDIEGARKAGMDQVFFNPKRIAYEQGANYEIGDLAELCKML